MAFIVQDAHQERFENLDAVIGFAGEEQKHIYRLPLRGYLERGARFQADATLGDGAHGLGFNEYGFDALCRLVGTNSYFLQRLSEPDLASAILNDVLLTGNATKPLDTLELVCDEASNQVLGIVSERFVGYSNQQFIDDVLNCLSSDPQLSLIPDTGAFEFMEAYSINTRLFMRIKSRHVVGTVTGRGGKGKDVSEIGVEFSNSMAGGHAVRLAYFIHRLICANGLIAQVAGGRGRLVHSGDPKKFRHRLHEKANGVLSGIQTAKTMIETLGEITFDSRKLAAHWELTDLLAIIPDPERREQCRAKFPSGDYAYIQDPEQRAIQKKADSIEQIPRCLGGQEALAVFDSHWRSDASMYDFINVFTEYAKTLDAARRLQTEEKAGDLANWMTSNKRHFS